MMLVKPGGQHGPSGQRFRCLEPFPYRAFLTLGRLTFGLFLGPLIVTFPLVDSFHFGYEGCGLPPADVFRNDAPPVTSGAIKVRVIAESFPPHFLTLHL